MLRPAYKLTVGSTTIDSETSLSAVVVRVEVEVDMDVPANWLAITLGSVDGLSVSQGDPVSVELGYAGDSLYPVLQAEVAVVECSVSTRRIVGLGPMIGLLDLRLHQTYEKQKSGGIVSDLASKAGVDTGTVEDGIEFPTYVVDDSQSAYEHARTLAGKNGFDLYLDVDNKLMFAEFAKTSADHVFEYGTHILALDVHGGEPAYGSVEVWGESAASSQGEDAASWLTKKPEDVMGQAGSGDPLLFVRDRSIRTKAAADATAQARLRWIERSALTGTLQVLGAPQVKLGDAVEVAGLSDAAANGVYQVRRVRHELSTTSGFVTTIDWMGL